MSDLRLHKELPPMMQSTKYPPKHDSWSDRAIWIGIVVACWTTALAALAVLANNILQIWTWFTR